MKISPPFVAAVMPFSSKHLHDGLKSTGKVTFNIASEASYLYILSGQKFTKNATNGQFWRDFETLKLAVKTVLPDKSVLVGQKFVENAQIEKFKCEFLSGNKMVKNVKDGQFWRVF